MSPECSLSHDRPRATAAPATVNARQITLDTLSRQGTLAIFRRVHRDYPETRVAIQACMRSTLKDLHESGDDPPKIRLVKGAFDETLDVSIRDRDEVTAQYQYLARWALEHLPDPAFGTHDDACIETVKDAARELGLDKRDFEFQMLQGVRRDVQEQLVRGLKAARRSPCARTVWRRP